MYCVFLGRAIGTVGIAAGSVTKDKVDFISDSSGSGVISKGDGSSIDGSIQLNCHVNSHGIKLKSPPHSAGQSYTLTFPSTAPSSGKFIQTDGSGNLSFATAGNSPAFEAYASSDLSLSNNVHTKQQYNTEVFDTDSAYDNSSNYRFTPQTAGKYFVYAQTKIEANADSLQFVQSSIYKNGSQYREQMHDARNNNGLQFSVFVSAIIDMNGSSDYVEGFVKGFVTGGNLYSRAGTKSTSFGAFRVG